MNGRRMNPMQVLGIYGSPRKGGNTDLMMDAFLEGSAETGAEINRIYARDMDIKGCLGCGHCDRKGRCIQKDEMGSVYSLFDRADRIVVAAPVYFYGVPGQLKLLIDRSQAPFMKRELEKAQTGTIVTNPDLGGFFLSAGATRGKRLFECSILTVRYFFDALGVTYAGELCYREIDERGAIRVHATALDECRQAGKRFSSCADWKP